MSRLIIWPDGTRFASDQLNNWVNQPTTTPDQPSNVNVYQSGLFTSSSFTYTASNLTIGNLIISLMDNWYYGIQDSVLVVATALNNIGVVLGYLNPATAAAATPTSVAASGQLFVNGATITMGGNVYATAFVDANNLTFTYDGTLQLGTYDVTVTNPDGKSFTFVQSFVIT